MEPEYERGWLYAVSYFCGAMLPAVHDSDPAVIVLDYCLFLVLMCMYTLESGITVDTDLCFQALLFLMIKQ